MIPVDFAPGVLYCRKCGAGISRKRGNLRTRASLFRAIEALRLKHELKCTGVRPAPWDGVMKWPKETLP
ncbi:MAG TPA: hypothetical protein VGY48_15910 [Vicinamibacterales bacterium]|nr:hypothetical protein [Vicinamibacterales bacterium]